MKKIFSVFIVLVLLLLISSCCSYERPTETLTPIPITAIVLPIQSEYYLRYTSNINYERIFYNENGWHYEKIVSGEKEVIIAFGHNSKEFVLAYLEE